MPNPDLGHSETSITLTDYERKALLWVLEPYKAVVGERISRGDIQWIPPLVSVLRKLGVEF